MFISEEALYKSTKGHTGCRSFNSCATQVMDAAELEKEGGAEVEETGMEVEDENVGAAPTLPRVDHEGGLGLTMRPSAGGASGLEMGGG